jgi:KUP system potassium uptake protein
MSVTSILFFAVMRRRIGLLPSIVLLVLFLIVDLAFFGANLAKIAHGGWVPIVLGFGVFVVMTTWKRGRTELGRCVRDLTLPLEPFLEEIEAKGTHRVPGTAIFMTSNADGLPLALRHHYEHNQVLHEEVVLLTVVVEHVPAVPRRKRVQVRHLGAGFFHVVAHYGFRQSPRIAGILRECREAGLDADMKHTSFYLGRETLLKDGQSGMSKLRKWLFAFISRNARPATAYFQIPPDRVVELGVQIRL